MPGRRRSRTQSGNDTTGVRFLRADEGDLSNRPDARRPLRARRSARVVLVAARTALGVGLIAYLALSGAIDWYHGSIALVGVTIGGYVAARVAKRIPQGLIRGLVIAYGLALTAWFFWSAYLG